MTRRRLGRAALTALLVAGPVAACTSGPQPEPGARAFLSDWAKRDYAAAAARTDGTQRRSRRRWRSRTGPCR